MVWEDLVPGRILTRAAFANATAVAMATSKWFDAPIIADGAASR